ncbi:unnamed protein product [Schistosoma mattheei]|uniref:Uncharacterized protein n=1 Tax=Schistosoma mattheei TaxID=31246 RepID=A0A183NR58_9TREM|nr:unnamed protein product [Schistosoma mattheei]
MDRQEYTIRIMNVIPRRLLILLVIIIIIIIILVNYIKLCYNKVHHSLIIIKTF